MKKTKGLILLIVFWFSMTICSLLIAQNEDLSVMKDWNKYTDKENVLYHHMSEEAFQYLQERTEALSQVSNLSDWQKRQALVKKKLMEIVGPFPEKTPLNPIITDTLIKTGYTVEKLHYESQPNF